MATEIGAGCLKYFSGNYLYTLLIFYVSLYIDIYIKKQKEWITPNSLSG